MIIVLFTSGVYSEDTSLLEMILDVRRAKKDGNVVTDDDSDVNRLKSARQKILKRRIDEGNKFKEKVEVECFSNFEDRVIDENTLMGDYSKTSTFYIGGQCLKEVKFCEEL